MSDISVSATCIWACPVCGQPLSESIISETHPGVLKCAGRHCFDKARSGYVHLLPVKQKHAKLPGDNPEMVRARRDFLDKGYYQALQEKLYDTVSRYLFPGSVLLDAGCGEGYYTSCISRLAAACYGVDISKSAADMAARRDKHTHYAVGSVFHLPVQDASCDMLISIFAPYCGNEFLRVLKEDACFIMVIPAARHLWELKQAIYDKPYENQVKAYALDNFRFLEKISVQDRIYLDNPEDIQNVFRMTPYAYRTGATERERLAQLTNLQVQIDFEILVYRADQKNQKEVL